VAFTTCDITLCKTKSGSETRVNFQLTYGVEIASSVEIFFASMIFTNSYVA
jgi:hypothetical protein